MRIREIEEPRRRVRAVPGANGDARFRLWVRLSGFGIVLARSGCLFLARLWTCVSGDSHLMLSVGRWWQQQPCAPEAVAKTSPCGAGMPGAADMRSTMERPRPSWRKSGPGALVTHPILVGEASGALDRAMNSAHPECNVIRRFDLRVAPKPVCGPRCAAPLDEESRTIQPPAPACPRA
jgi:hypothetical protein